MTMIPASRPLIPNFVWSTPVAAPAMAPVANPASVATDAGAPSTSNTAAVAAPTVIEPSVVMSGNLNTRKLTKTPKASSERMSPTVQAPISSVISSRLGADLGDRRDPTGAAHERALPASHDPAVVVQQVKHALHRLRFEQRADRFAQFDLPFAERAIRERRGMEMRGYG